MILICQYTPRGYRSENYHTPRGFASLVDMTTSPTRGYTAEKDQLGARLRRIEGQVRGVERMVEDDRYCIDVLTQISAIQAALDKVALGLLDGHARHCMSKGSASASQARDGQDGAGAPGEAGSAGAASPEAVSTDDMATELMAAVGRLLKRG